VARCYKIKFLVFTQIISDVPYVQLLFSDVSHGHRGSRPVPSSWAVSPVERPETPIKRSETPVERSEKRIRVGAPIELTLL
jgi:hypothetical protein